MGLVFNTDLVAPDPTSWEALWNDDYAGHVVTPTAVDGSSIFITAIAEMVGTSWDGDLEPVWDKLEELRPNVLTQYASAGQMVNLLQTEAAWIGPWYNGRAWTAIDQGLPLGYVTPDEGAMIVLIDLVIPQGAPNVDAAYAFVNFALEERQQAAFAERFSYAPAREGVELSEEAARKVPYGEEGVERLIVPDWEEFIALTDAWAERWLQIFGAPED
jgi:putative spermidine/putrescine transport system substrate-binding protein